MYDRSALSVLVVDWLRLSVAVLPLLAATCAPLADELVVLVVVAVDRFELSVVERFELSVIDRSALSVLVLVVDWLRLSVALLPLLAATCAPDAPLLSVLVVVFVRALLELSVVELFA
ncbi:hypothetical protein GCM10022253_15890 [Sphingomonas endophytica]